MRRLAVLAIAISVAVTAAGCGSSSDAAKRPALIVSAASSLRNAFTDYGNDFKPALVRLSFAGSDELAAQIRAGGRADVFAAANQKLPAALFKEGKVEKPVDFTANRLVLAVPKGSSVNSIDDVAKPGVKLGIGSETVPVGIYTRKVLSGLPSIERNRILANVKTAEPDVAGIVGKLTQGAVNAGFVYATDVAAAGDSLKAVQLPARLQPTVVYAAAIVKGTKHHDQAKAFLDGLVRGTGQDDLKRAGFLAVP
jgi:molybdate transport system substrate-binding protein